MNKKWIVAVAIAAAPIVPTVARAHKGHAHKIMGTVSGVEGNHVMVKTTDGKTKLDAAAVKVGERVVAEGIEEKEMIMAKTVKLAEVAATTKK